MSSQLIGLPGWPLATGTCAASCRPSANSTVNRADANPISGLTTLSTLPAVAPTAGSGCQGSRESAAERAGPCRPRATQYLGSELPATEVARGALLPAVVLPAD